MGLKLCRESGALPPACNWGRTMTQNQPFCRRFSPSKFPGQYDPLRCGLPPFGDSCFSVDLLYLLQGDTERAPEVLYPLGIVSLAELPMKAFPGDVLWFVGVNPVQPLRQPSVDIETHRTMRQASNRHLVKRYGM